jgi:two-component system, NarL family, nitrate/nitrite response regulator NarL
MSERIHVVIVGMRPLLADSVRLVLAGDPVIEVLGVVDEEEDLPESTASSTIDVLVFDGRQRGMEFGSLIRWWKRLHPSSRAVAIDLEGAEPVLEWIACGLDAFVGPQAPLGDVLDSVSGIARGEVRCPPQLVTRIVARIQAASGAKQTGEDAALTVREIQVLQLLAEGLSNKEIATRLDISLYTVKNHVHNLLEKMKVPYRRQAIRFGIEKGLLRPRSVTAQSGSERIRAMR